MKKFDLIREKQNTLTNINAARCDCVEFNVDFTACALPLIIVNNYGL